MECFLVLAGGIVTSGKHYSDLVLVGNRKRPTAVPLKEVTEFVKLGLWSMLCRAPAVKKPFPKTSRKNYTYRGGHPVL